MNNNKILDKINTLLKNREKRIVKLERLKKQLFIADVIITIMFVVAIILLCTKY